jgi:hypothetical protein
MTIRTAFGSGFRAVIATWTEKSTRPIPTATLIHVAIPSQPDIGCAPSVRTIPESPENKAFVVSVVVRRFHCISSFLSLN